MKCLLFSFSTTIVQRAFLSFSSCGRGNKGSKIVDAVDQCCFAHDNCYTNTWYDYTSVTADIQCTDRPGTADYQACQCDRQAALCFRSSPYISANRDYPQSQC